MGMGKDSNLKLNYWKVKCLGIREGVYFSAEGFVV